MHKYGAEQRLIEETASINDYLDTMFAGVFRLLTGKSAPEAISRHNARGISVVVNNTRPDIATADVIARLDRTLALIERYVPHHYRHLKRDFGYVIVQRFACRGAYLHEQRACLVELTFTVNPDFSDAEVAATILHEAMHARLHRLGFPLEMEDRARQERFCRRAELEFGALVPNGERVIERALWTVHQSDEDVAPVIDPNLAAERIAEVDRQALRSRSY